MSFEQLAARRKKIEQIQKHTAETQKLNPMAESDLVLRRLRAKRSLDGMVGRVLGNLCKAAYPKCKVRNQEVDLFASRLMGEWSIGCEKEDDVWENRVSVFLVIDQAGNPLHFKCFSLDQEEDSLGIKEKDLIEALLALHERLPDAVFRS